MTATLVTLGLAVFMIVVTSLAIRYQREAAGMPEYEDDLAGVAAHDQQRAALARITGTEQRHG